MINNYTTLYRFTSDALVHQRYVFTHLKVNGTFRDRNQRLSVTMPSTLTSNLLPLPADGFSFNDSSSALQE